MKRQTEEVSSTDIEETPLNRKGKDRKIDKTKNDGKLNEEIKVEKKEVENTNTRKQ